MFGNFQMKKNESQERIIRTRKSQLSKMRGHSNWITFRDSFLLRPRVTPGRLSHSIECLVDNNDRLVHSANAQECGISSSK